MNFKLAFLAIAILGYTIPASSMYIPGTPDYSNPSSPQESPVPSRPATPEPVPHVQSQTSPQLQPQEAINRPVAQQALNAAGNTVQRILVSPDMPNHPRQGFLESWFPRTFNQADKATTAAKTTADALKTMSENGATINHAVTVDPKSMNEFNRTWVSLMKTYLTAGIGGAIAVTGVILLFKTLMSEKSNTADTRPLYKRILTNRYLISALLMATGTGIILKSDTIVAAVS